MVGVTTAGVGRSGSRCGSGWGAGNRSGLGRAPARQAPPRSWVPAALCLPLALVAACDSPTDEGPPHGVPACTTEPVFTVSPLPLEKVAFLSPRGATQIVFQKHHLGVHLAWDHPTAEPVVAPGDMNVVEVTRVTFTSGSGEAWSDYALRFYPCADLLMYWGHLASLAPEVEAQLGPWSGAECRDPYVVHQSTVVQCHQRVPVQLTAGTLVGTLGGPDMPTALDWGAYDRRGPPLAFIEPAWYGGHAEVWSGNYVVCSIDYFAEPLRTILTERFGDSDAPVTGAPPCGRTMWDVPGRARGRWFFNGSVDETLHLALVPDPVRREIGVFNVGSTIPNLPQGIYWTRSAVVGEGLVNRDLEQVASDGAIYCYELRSQMAVPYLAFIQLTASDRIRIDGGPGESCGDPSGWGFTPAAVQFRRRLSG